MQPKYKSPFIRILTITGIDVVLLTAFIIWMHPNDDEAALEYLLALAIFVINIGFAVAAKFALRKLYLLLILNSVIAVIIFHLLFNGWYGYVEQKMRFSSAGKKYELVLDRRDTSYNFTEIDASGKLMSGQYKISNDTMYLTDPVNQMAVYKDTLIGFAKGKIALKNE